jgi:hypothetical protein
MSLCVQEMGVQNVVFIADKDFYSFMIAGSLMDSGSTTAMML